MNAKIKPWLPWMNIGLVIMLLFLIEYILMDVLHLRIGSRWYSLFMYAVVMPGLEIMRYITIDTINWFGGGEVLLNEFIKSAAISVAALLILFIIAPWFFAKGLLNKNSENQPSGLSWYFATPIIVMGILAPLFFGIGQIINNVQGLNQRSIESNQMLTQLRSYMTDVAFDASEWWILPEEAGGGDGSFIIHGDQTLALNDLDSYDPEHPDFELIVEETPSDSTMTLRGVLKDERFDRKVRIKITPGTNSLLTFR